jgi:hypothetical protein
MADADLSSQFTTRTDGLNVETSCGLVALLNSVAGVQIADNPSLNRNLKQTAVGVSSSFVPLDCNAGAPASAVPGGPSGPNASPPGESHPGTGTPFLATGTYIGNGSSIAHPAGLSVLTVVRDKLLRLGSAFNEVVNAIDAGIREEPVSLATPERGAPKCYRYQSTQHGPLGLFRSREFLQVSASGTLEFLGGVQQANASANYIMYLEYAVNTFLSGKPAWIIDPATRQPVFDNKLLLAAQQGCTAAEPQANIPSCGSDTVVDTMRVVVNFKKVFIAAVGGGVQTPTFSGSFQGALASLAEQSFTGVVPFTHRIGVAP